MSARAEILEAARQAVTQDRAATHGPVEDTFGAIAAVWSARLGVAIAPWQVAILLGDLKSCRAWGNPGHRDNWVDLAGYAACGGELAAREAVPVCSGAGIKDSGNSFVHGGGGSGAGACDFSNVRRRHVWDEDEP